jgi:hypothetical protein
MPDRTSDGGVACDQRIHPDNLRPLERRFRSGVAGVVASGALLDTTSAFTAVARRYTVG